MPQRQTDGSSAIETDVAIVGGGPAGLCLALALSQANGVDLSVRVFDAAAGGARRADPRGWAIAPAPRHVLEAIGVWDEIAPHAGEVRRMAISDSKVQDPVRPELLGFGVDESATDPGLFGDEEGVPPGASRLDDPFYDIPPGAEELGMPLAHIVPAEVLVAAVDNAASNAGLKPQEPHHLRSLEPDSAGITLNTDQGPIRARLCVGADGVNSTVRSLAGIRTVDWDYRQDAIVATLDADFAHDGTAIQHFLPGGPFALLPLPENRLSLVWSDERDKVRALMALDDAAFETELNERAGPELGWLNLAGARASFPLGFMLSRRFVAPRVALIGDAAHRVHPLAGQGLNLGLKDVAALAETIVETVRLGIDPGIQTELETYERWRRADTVQLAMLTDGLNRLFRPDIAPLRLIRSFGLGLVNNSGFAKRFLTREAAGLNGPAVPKLMDGLPL
ncbi:MAG: FAD-dependent monooxygenase [Pseudomonadota bacterium]